MSYLNWIDDKDIEIAVTHLLEKAKEAQLKASTKFGNNVIDPFAAIFEISGFELDYDLWLKNETTRQAQKTLQNHIGEFHQIVLGSCKGWKNMKTGNVIDLVSKKNLIVAEIKNKFNTISGGKLSDLYYSLDNLIMPKSSIYRNYTAYYVTIIPRKPERFNKPFTPSDKNKSEKCHPNERIREIDGASFYDMVTGESNALKKLFDTIPDVIFKCSQGQYKVKNKNKLRGFFDSAFG